ncbi:CaiB/BaiF CoA transferase family protein [Parvularcula marina]|uniref:CoA transferase n=1 Tax=Parvularcula marina TaxID=2292771 RepID=A0A371RLF2_9PROT|nr:CaiB/BaiF CoA-transferase family protein [Parvularcula marina]RFB06273.1 CoA transferase [Parvularcula marina]
MSPEALQGVRVLDVSRILAAPLATQLLGDLGAEIIKVERPGVGDESRTYGPPFLKRPDGSETQVSAFYLSCNRNKRSIAIDFSKADGRDLILSIAENSDVFIENFKVGTLERYGLGYEDIKAVNPRIIYCSVTGFGQTGPMADRPGYDGIFQAMSGMMNVSGHADSKPGGGPMRVGISMVDILTSLYTANAIQAALYHRDTQGGNGQYIDVSLLDCGLASLSHFAMSYFTSGEVPQRRGNCGFGGVPSESFDCSDGMIFLTAGNQRQFASLCHALGRPELLDDPLFAAPSQRVINRDPLSVELSAEFAKKTTAEAFALLDKAGVPTGRVNDLREAIAEPQIQHREMVRNIPHPDSGELSILSNPLRFSGTPVKRYAPPPAIGEHTTQILGEIGLQEEEIDALCRKGIITAAEDTTND